MRVKGLVGVALLVAAACSSVRPVAISKGDTCVRCGRTITQERLAAEILDENGEPKKFRTVACMATYLADRPGSARNIFVTDYSSGELVPAGTANYVRTVIDTASGERDYLSFASFQQAMRYSTDHQLQKPIDWAGVRVTVAESN
jgi:hypothetical protein